MTPPPARPDPLSVLVVDADASGGASMARALERRGCEVRVVDAESVPVPQHAAAFEVAVITSDGSRGCVLRLIRALRASCPCACVLIVTGPDRSLLDRAVAMGVTEILFGSVSVPELESAVRRAAAVSRRWRAQLERAGISTRRRAAMPLLDLDACLDGLTRRGNLTGREREVLAVMLRGRRIEEIARGLHISENTVKFHVRNVLRKLELRSRSELLRLLSD